MSRFSCSVCFASLLFFSLQLCSNSSLSAQDKKPIKVGSKAFTENVILSEMLVHLIRSTGRDIRQTSEMGSRVAFDGLRNGELDVYPEYTGTITGELLAGRAIRDEQELRKALEADGIKMSEKLGFNNTYAIGLKRVLAEELKLKKISDLARTDDPRIAALRCGFSEEFMQRTDGWPGLVERYQLPQRPQTLHHNLAYQGVQKGAIDLTDLYSTDAEIRSYDLIVLEDDLGFFPVYECVWLYRDDLATRAPEVIAAMKSLEGKLTNDDMIALNARVVIDRQSETRVAGEFLNERFALGVKLPTDDRTQEILRNLWRNTRDHLALVAISLLAAITIALPLGIAAGKVRWLAQLVLSAVGIIQTIPALVILVTMIPLFGFGFAPAVCALTLYGLLPIVRGVYSGLTEIPTNLRESALVLGLPPWARLWRIELPLASRSILSGIKTAAVITVGTATIGAFIGAGGYGNPILAGLRLADWSLILQGALPAALLAIAAQVLFEVAERFLVPAGLRK